MASMTVTQTTEERRRDWSAALTGARDMLPVTLALAPLGLLAGAHVAESAVRNDVGLLGGMAVYGASAQITVVTLLSGGASLLAIVGAVLVINARGLIYSAALAPQLARQPAWFRWSGPFLLVDPLFALASRQGDEDISGRELREYFLGAGLSLWIAWFWIMLAGVSFGQAVPDAEWVRFGIPAAFVGFLVPGLVNRRAVLAAVVGGLVAAVALGLPGGLGLMLAALAGAALEAPRVWRAR